MIAPAQILDTKALLETSAGALAAGVGTPAALSLAILGFAKGPSHWREGDRLRGSLFSALGAAALLASLALVVVGLAIVIDGPS
jgi:hypothetical protein